MPRNLVLKDGVLSAVVENYEPVEMTQLQAEVEARQQAFDALQAQVDEIANQLEAAKGSLEDSKSDLETGRGLVEGSPADSGSEDLEAGADAADGAVENPEA